MPIPFEFDWKNPDWHAVLTWRANKLMAIRRKPECLPQLRAYYADHPAQFIIDWGMTYDPRNADIGQPTSIPFLLFAKQEEFCERFMAHWQARENWLAEKSRDLGFSWMAVCLGATLCLFRPGVTFGYGSRKAELVDKIGDNKSLFWKARYFLDNLPAEFRGEYEAPHMRINFMDTGSSMIGEAGDNIGRGGRASVYIVDESAYLEQQDSVDAALSQTTNCRLDVSSPNGPENSFARKRKRYPPSRIFTAHWRDDPRKDEAWYATQVADLEALVVAQELDLSYAAMAENVLIPSAWVQAAVDAHVKLGIEPTGKRTGAMDPADEGKDTVGFCAGRGILIDLVDEWSGVGGDLYDSTLKVFGLCDEHAIDSVTADADGLGSGVRGDARVINENRRAKGQRRILFSEWRGSGAVVDPEGQMIEGRVNKDTFRNAKDQAWWRLRLLFRNTFRALAGQPYEPDEIISLSSKMEKLDKLMIELSQPTYGRNTTGKYVIDKAPNGARSPNLADAVMIRSQPGNDPLAIWEKLAEAS